MRTSGRRQTDLSQNERLFQTSAWLSLVLLGAISTAIFFSSTFLEHVFAAGRFHLSNHFAYFQDLAAAPILMAFFLLAMFGVRRTRWTLREHSRLILCVALLVLVVTLAGTYVVFGSFDLSMDEVMANFDMRILRTGSLFAALPVEWRPFRDALQPIFLLHLDESQLWSSAYLPGNAAIRALVDLIGSARLANPLMAAASVAVVYAIARKLRPGDSEFAWVATLLFATSSQLLVTAMTAYSMTAHLFLNLVWLWFVLHDRWWSRLGALAATVIATGLHQLVFHPLFAAPFLLWLAWERRWNLVLLYGAGLATAGIFWTLYWPLAVYLTGAAAQSDATVGGGYLVERIVAMARSAFTWTWVTFTADNLLRLATWQNPMLWPLLFAAIARIRRQPTIAWALLGGILATFATMLVLMPYQGHGWGYRYLHGLLGNFALLGAFGWRVVKPPGCEKSDLPPIAVVAVILSIVCLLPVRSAQARAFALPYARADAAISRLDADLVIIDPSARWYSQDLVRNDPFLRNRPLRMVPNKAVLAQARVLCARYKVALIYYASPQLREIQMVALDRTERSIHRRLAVLRRAGCGTAEAP